MATKYVDFVNGNDANNGNGPDASDSTNKPYKTITKLLVGSGMASGDTAYLSPSGPFRETISVGLTPSGTTTINADPANAQGFKDGSGNLVTPGPVIVTAYTTNDKTAPSATTLLNLNGKSFLAFKGITFVNGQALTVTATTTTSHDITFQDCSFLAGYLGASGHISVTAAHNTALNWTIDRCTFFGGGNTNPVTITGTLGAVADWDMNVVITNCTFGGVRVANCITVATTSAGANKPGGVKVRNCSILGGTGLATPANHSTSVLSFIDNSFLYCPAGSVGVSAAAASTTTEDYNLIVSSTPRSNVTAGTHSISDGSYAPLFHFGQETLWGALPRPFGAPMSGSPLLGFGNDGSQTAYDALNRARPAGGVSASPAAGALERGNTWTKETATVRTGSNAVSITGPGYQDFQVPVDATSTTVSVYMRYDSTYAGTKPVMSVTNGTECGVTDATSSAVVTVNTWEQLSLTFTPTSKGIVTIRLTSTDTNGGGKAFADDFAVA